MSIYEIFCTFCRILHRSRARDNRAILSCPGDEILTHHPVPPSILRAIKPISEVALRPSPTAGRDMEAGESPARARRCDRGRKPLLSHCVRTLAWEGAASRTIRESEDPARLHQTRRVNTLRVSECGEHALFLSPPTSQNQPAGVSLHRPRLAVASKAPVTPCHRGA